jgi:hypothetical protein
MSSPQDRFAGEPPPGTRDTGSDKPSGGEDRPSGPYKGDESVPIHSEEDDPGFGTKFTNEAPHDVEPTIPPYEGRKTEADSGSTEAQGAKIGGATAPATDPDYKSPAPSETAGGATSSPADEQPASGGSESDADDDGVGPAHAAGTGRAEDKR